VPRRDDARRGEREDSPISETTGAEALTAEQLRDLFEQQIGITCGRNRELWWMLDRVIVAAQDERDESNHREVAVLARHFPGLERAIMAVWHHVTQTDDGGPCSICEPAGGEVAS
jgi:hypothetical protein